MLEKVGVGIVRGELVGVAVVGIVKGNEGGGIGNGCDDGGTKDDDSPTPPPTTPFGEDGEMGDDVMFIGILLVLILRAN